MNNNKIEVKIKKLAHYQGLDLPSYQTEEAAGMDLLAAVGEEGYDLKPGSYDLIPAGIAIELPEGYEAQVRPRSGLAVKYGIGILNSPGTIDADYRGEIKVVMINHGKDEFHIERGMRIAQMIIAPVTKACLIEVADLNDTDRSSGGFGHTGI